MLAMLDTGMLIGNPLVGRMVEYSQQAGLPPYSTTFVTLSVGVTVIGIWLRTLRTQIKGAA